MDKYLAHIKVDDDFLFLETKMTGDSLSSLVVRCQRIVYESGHPHTLCSYEHPIHKRLLKIGSKTVGYIDKL